MRRDGYTEVRESTDVIEDSPPILRLEVDSHPETLTLVRGALGGVAELLELDPELLDDLKTAVSEACNNVVMHAYPEPGPVCVALYVKADAVVALVRDEGGGIPSLAPSDDRIQGIGIPIIQALASDSEFRPLPKGGTEVWMSFEARRAGKPLLPERASPGPENGWLSQLSGDAVVSLSPVGLVGGVLGRLARASAARARFSLDRFSDVYLVTDALAAHAHRATSGSRIGFALSTDTRRLELTIGPFRPGTSAQLSEGARDDVRSALRLLSDELKVQSADGAESLHLVMIDRPRPTSS